MLVEDISPAADQPESQAVGQPPCNPCNPTQDFIYDLRHRLCGAWGAVEGVNLRAINNKVATYQALFALCFDHNVRKPMRLTGYEGLCALSRKYSELFAHPFLQHQLRVQAVSNFPLQRNKKLFYFISELLDLLWAGVDQSQADQSCSLAEGLPL
eukprot:1154111-Pelagomonas_calceolata.AAC.1